MAGHTAVFRRMANRAMGWGLHNVAGHVCGSLGMLRHNVFHACDNAINLRTRCSDEGMTVGNRRIQLLAVQRKPIIGGETLDEVLFRAFLAHIKRGGHGIFFNNFVGGFAS